MSPHRSARSCLGHGCRDILFDICLDFGGGCVEDMSRHLPKNLEKKRDVMSCRDICLDRHKVNASAPLGGSTFGKSQEGSPMRDGNSRVFWPCCGRFLRFRQDFRDLSPTVESPETCFQTARAARGVKFSLMWPNVMSCRNICHGSGHLHVMSCRDICLDPGDI